MNQLKHISSSEFESEVLMSDTPVLVDFYATWCMPCQLLSPVLEKLAEEFRGRVKFVKVDTDQEPSLAAAEDLPPRERSGHDCWPRTPADASGEARGFRSQYRTTCSGMRLAMAS